MITKTKKLSQRISISLPPELAGLLDQLVVERGFSNRSQAIREMINQQLSRHQQERGSRVMAGTITIFYDESKPSLRQKLAAIQRSHINEVISSQHILLENNHTMEVILVQGPANKLRLIANEFVSCKGVATGGLNLSTTVMPPIHGRVSKRGK